jgi:uncharacterized protein DUF6328
VPPRGGGWCHAEAKRLGQAGATRPHAGYVDRVDTSEREGARSAEPTPENPREETAAERLDRNMAELMGELRVVVTGVQVLFAFLLVVPFDQGFEKVNSFERDVYFATLVLAALAAALVLAPSAHHRLLFRLGAKRDLVAVANWMAIAGMGAMALAIGGALALVAAFLFGDVAGVVAFVVASVALVALWVLPAAIVRRRSR